MMHTVFNSSYEFHPYDFFCFISQKGLTNFVFICPSQALFQISNSFIPCYFSGWELHGLHCYQFFNVRHSWQKASELCKRYGSDLATVDSFAQNNFTSQLASRFLAGQDQQRYWLGLKSHNDLQTNTLQAGYFLCIKQDSHVV